MRAGIGDALTDLTDRVIVVTGGSRGLGREIVLACAARGAQVVITSRKLDACEALAATVEERFGTRAVVLACNVGDWDQCTTLSAEVDRAFGRVDVLVNNAGISPRYDSLEGVTEALYDKVLGVNLKGPFRLSALIGARMSEGDGGSIVNISSTTSLRPAGDALPVRDRRRPGSTPSPKGSPRRSVHTCG